MLICTIIVGDRARREFELLSRSMQAHHPEVQWLVATDPGSGQDSGIKGSWDGATVTTLRIVPPGLPFDDLMMMKMEIMKHSIDRVGYAIYWDCDMIVLRKGVPDFVALLESHELVLSPHYTSPWRENLYGKFNAGMLALKSLAFLDVWQNLTARKSWYLDQKPLEIASQGRKIYELGMEHNFGHWRYPIPRITEDGLKINALSVVTYHGHLYDSTDPYDLQVIRCIKDQLH